MSTHQNALAAPFDAIAARYDDTFTSSHIGQAQRAAVWRELEKAFHPGDRVLEIGCGTGVDACFLAERGIRILACDPSPEMIEVTTRRVHELWLNHLVHPMVLGAEDLSSLPPDEPFDGAFSNFGALNCVDDLAVLAHNLARLLKPGASACLCWMGPYCAWEMLWYLAHGDTAKAFRRLQSNGVQARIAEGTFVHVHYPSLRVLAQNFSPHFELKSVRAIGLTVPPSYVEPWIARHLRLLQWCRHIDSLLRRTPGLRSLGDHVLVRLQRTKSSLPEAA
jgi:ubiquinone/menaquinone biosynthesis C-methylase UbiE